MFQKILSSIIITIAIAFSILYIGSIDSIANDSYIKLIGYGGLIAYVWYVGIEMRKQAFEK